VYLLLARMIFSFLALGRDANPTLLQIRKLVYRLTEPVLSYVRKIIRPVHLGGGGYLDLSPIIVILLLNYLVLPLLRRIILGF